MCGRYYIEQDYNVAQLMQIIIQAREKAQRAGEDVRTGEIFPTNVVPVIALNRKRQKSVFPMKWGFYSSEKKVLVINARSESANELPLFRESMRERRCVIPASGYYEWHEKEKYGITTGRRVIFMAGIYRFEGERAVFCVLTTTPTESVSKIHNRMPLIIPGEMSEAWITGAFKIEDATRSCRPSLEISRFNVEKALG